MFARLMGSAPGHQQSAGATGASFMLHATLLGLAIQFSSRVAAPLPDPEPPEHIVYSAPRAPVHLAAGPQLPPHCDPCAAPVLPVIEIQIEVPEHIPNGIPVTGAELIDAQGIVAPVPQQMACEVCGGFTPTVDVPARARRGNPRPVYPSLLRSAHVEGEIEAHFVVDSTGRVDAPSITFDSGGDPLFESAVRRALLASRYEPARAGGRPVAMRVDQEFAFRITP